MKKLYRRSGRVSYKFSEDKTLLDLRVYIDKTYEQHYGRGQYQATDMIIDSGHGESFCIGNIMKYAMRFGKKDNKKVELQKIIHYAIIALHLQDTTDH